jgi:hypothetical protein
MDVDDADADREANADGEMDVDDADGVDWREELQLDGDGTQNIVPDTLADQEQLSDDVQAKETVMQASQEGQSGSHH